MSKFRRRHCLTENLSLNLLSIRLALQVTYSNRFHRLISDGLSKYRRRLPKRAVNEAASWDTGESF